MTQNIATALDALDHTTQALLSSQGRALQVSRLRAAHLWLAPEQVAPMRQAQVQAQGLADEVLQKPVRELIATIGKSDRFLTLLIKLSSEPEEEKLPTFLKLTQSRLADTVSESAELVADVVSIHSRLKALEQDIERLVDGAKHHSDAQSEVLRDQIEQRTARLREINQRQIELLISEGATVGEWVSTTLKILPPVAKNGASSDEPIVTLERVEADVSAVVKNRAEINQLRDEATRIFNELAERYLALYEHQGSVAITLAFLESIVDLVSALGRSVDHAQTLHHALEALDQAWALDALQNALLDRTGLEAAVRRVNGLRRQISGQPAIRNEQSQIIRAER